MPRAASPAWSIRRTASKTTWPTRSRPAARSAIREVVEAGDRRGPAADRGTDRLGHPLRHGRRPASALGREGGHGHDRIVHALGDATGKEVMRAVTERLAGLDHVEVWEQTFTIDLLTLDGACRGAVVWNQEHGKTLVWAKQTILATGGAGSSIAKRPTRPWPPATAWPWPIAPGPSCATWSSCSSIPRCCTSPAAAAA